MCVGGLTTYIFGGFDGDTDLNDLWELQMLQGSEELELELEDAAPPPARRTAHAAHCLRRGVPFDVDVFKARQRRAANVLHATPSFANADGTSVHNLVSQAWRLRRDVR